MKVKDAVCGVEIDVGTAKVTLEFNGKILHFCSTACSEEFKRAPETYLAEADASCDGGRHRHGHHSGCCGGHGRHH